MALTDEQRVSIAGKIKVLQSEIDERTEAIENLKRTLSEDLGVIKTTVGDFFIDVYQSKQFNAAWAKKMLPAEAIKRATKMVPTFTAATAQDRAWDADGNIIKGLTEEEYALAQKPSDKGLSVKIELVED